VLLLSLLSRVGVRVCACVRVWFGRGWAWVYGVGDGVLVGGPMHSSCYYPYGRVEYADPGLFDKLG